MKIITGDLYRTAGSVYRVLAIKEGHVLLADCLKSAMPKWEPQSMLEAAEKADENDLPAVRKEAQLSGRELAAARKRYSMIAGILPFVGDEKQRSVMIRKAAETFNVSRRTIVNNLCRYLAYGDTGALADREKPKAQKPLTADEKNFRWALNKFYYTRHGNSLMESYVQMLKEKYCDSEGQLLPGHPTIHQFRYFFKKTRKKQTELISREGIKEYQLNYRPLLGEGVQEMAPAAGWGMLDGTVCDIYLVDGSGNLAGRPVLLANIDAYSGLCCGYSLLWEGGVYSVRELMLNTVADKVEWCRKFGIEITQD